MRGWIKSNSTRANRHWQSGGDKSVCKWSPAQFKAPPTSATQVSGSRFTWVSAESYAQQTQTIGPPLKIISCKGKTYIKVTVKMTAPESFIYTPQLKLSQMALQTWGDSFLQVQGYQGDTFVLDIPKNHSRTSGITTTWVSGGALLPLTQELVWYFKVDDLNINNIRLHATELRFYDMTQEDVTALNAAWSDYMPSTWYFTFTTKTATEAEWNNAQEIAGNE